MTKEHILAEIKRTAKGNGGVPFGSKRFLTETGIKESDWRGRFWVRWGDALIEAGFTPNEWSEGYADEWVIGRYVQFAKELGRLPVMSELEMKRRSDATFPSIGVFKRLGSSKERLSKAAQYCEGRAGFEDVLLLCKSVAAPDITTDQDDSAADKIGYVYLLKHGSRREYKIGMTLNPLRREGEIGIQLPDKLEPVHYIKTDDPSGVEAYWHARFKGKRKEGEWFLLTPADVKAFKRWRSIY